MIRRIRIGLLVVYLLVAVQMPGHEMQDNRATLVLREGNHVSLTLYLNWLDVLRRVLAPQAQMAEFLAAYSAINPEEFQKQLHLAESRLQSSVRLISANDAPILLVNWRWPSVKEVRASMQKQIMQAIVDPAAHSHEEPVEIHAEGVSVSELESVKVQFPVEFQKVLVVSYKPSQVWVEQGSVSAAIKFQTK